jgi:hypothetical protein
MLGQSKKMRGIGICLDGLIAFLAAAALADILLVSLAVCSLRGLIQVRRKGERFCHQPVYPHLIGMLISLSCYVVIMLSVWLSFWTPRPHTLNIWLDDFVLLWAVIVLALWPVSSHAFKRWSRQRSIAPRSGT